MDAWMDGGERRGIVVSIIARHYKSHQLKSHPQQLDFFKIYYYSYIDGSRAVVVYVLAKSLN